MTPLDSINKRQKDHDRLSRIDFLMGTLKKEVADVQQLVRPKVSKTNVVKIFLIILLIFLITGAMYLSEVVFSTPTSELSSLNKFNPFKQLALLVTSADKRLSGESKDRVNFLLMGVGGAGHEGPYLTDTIMVASLKPSTLEAALISLPRDLLVPLPSGEWQKINQVYAFGKTQKSDGIQMITKVIDNILDLKINYYAVLDFTGFEKLIDDLGGININVEKGFVDSQYPTDDFLTTTVSFNAGPQLMDGKTALMFARSRHGGSGEGSDFSRSKRQQLILEAVQGKVMTISTLINPKKIASIFELPTNHLETNLPLWQVLKLSQLSQSITPDHIYRLVIDDSPGGLLESVIMENGEYVLKPTDNSYEKLQNLTNNIFDLGKIKSEAAAIELLNGTETSNLAYYTNLYLKRLNYHIINYGNAPTKDYQRTIIYDFTDGQKKTTLKNLAKELQGYITKTIPDYIKNIYPNATSTPPSLTPPQKPDLLVILGVDYALKFKLPETMMTATTTEETATTTLETQ